MKKFLYAVCVTMILVAGWTSAVAAGETLGDGTGSKPSTLGSNTGPGPSVVAFQLKSPLKDPFNSPEGLLGAVLRGIRLIGVPIIVLMFVWIGFQYVINAGNANAIGKIHDQLLYTVIGALIILGAEVIRLVVSGTINQLAQ